MTRLSPGALLMGVFAVLFGLIGAYVAKQHLRETPEPEPVAVELRQTVPLAAVDLPPGRTLTLGDVILVKMTREQMKAKGLPRDHMTNPRQVIGRTLRESVGRGKVFQTTAFYPEGTGPSVAERLKPGYRAVTVSLEDTAAAVGLVSPGAFVDVILRTFSDKKENLPETTVTLLDSVEVLAIGPETFRGSRTMSGQRPPARGLTTVTLAVTPEQASALKVVEGRGTMSLVLRKPGEGQPANLPAPKTLAELLGLPEPEQPFVTEIYRGGQLTTAAFEMGRRTAVRHDTFGAFPVGMVRPRDTISTAASMSTATPTPTLAARPDSTEPEPCGCEEE